MMPRFVHDCENCRLIGQYEHPNFGTVDLYVCDNDLWGQTWIWRHGNDGWEYGAFPIVDALRDARKYTNDVYAEIARKCGFVIPKG